MNISDLTVKFSSNVDVGIDMKIVFSFFSYISCTKHLPMHWGNNMLTRLIFEWYYDYDKYYKKESQAIEIQLPC